MSSYRRIIVGLLVVSSLQVAAQPVRESQSKRPRIGLALAGGGALGLAHIGVLKWLYEHQIPIDYIAGTSFGGLVGGLYATGHTPEEMEAFVKAIDWDFTLAPGPEFRQLIYRRKEDARDYPSRFEFGYKKGVKIPSGLSSGHGVGLVISRFAAPWPDLKSFDELPTPFRCIATDLISTKQIVFDQGPLFDALRATMSIPAVFTPVRQDGMVLVDGGIVNNLPVDVVRKMGAEIVIAVTLEPPADPKAKYDSLLSVAGRSVSVLITTNERRSLALADVVIGPNSDGLTTTDYKKSAEFFTRGEKAAQDRRLILEKLSVGQAAWDDYVNRRRRLRRPEEVKPQVVEVVGDLPPERMESMKRGLQADPSKPLQQSAIEDALTRLTGLGRYEGAHYSFIKRPKEEGLLIEMKEKDHGPPFFRVAFTIDGNTGDTLRFGVSGRLTFMDFGGPLSEWRTDISAGEPNRVASEYYYRINGSRYFVAPYGSYEERPLRIFSQGQELASYSNRNGGGGVDLGYNFGRFKEVRFGYRIYHLENVIDTGLDFLPNFEGTVSELRARWVHEGQNSAMVPTSGSRASVEFFYGFQRPQVQGNYPGVDVTYSYARPVKGRVSLLSGAGAGVTKDSLGLAYRFQVGGPANVSSLSPYELIGSRYYRGGAFGLAALTNESIGLFGRFYGALGYELGRAWSPGGPATPRHSGTLGLMGETPFGLVFLGGAIGDQGDKKLFFRLGRIF